MTVLQITSQWKLEWKCLHLSMPVMNPRGLFESECHKAFQNDGDSCLLWQMQEAAAEIKLKHLLPVEAEGRTK